MRVFECLLAVSYLLTVMRADGSESKEPPTIYDVTTIYRLKETLPESHATEGFLSGRKLDHPGVMEVHGRTNARGLPFRLSNGINLGPNIGVDLPEWQPTEDMSGYVTNNFTNTIIDPTLDTPILNTNEACEYSYEIKSYETRSELRQCGSTGLNFDLEVTESIGYGELTIYLFQKRTYTHNNNNNNNNNNDIVYWIRCVYTGDVCILYKCNYSPSLGEEKMMINVHEDLGSCNHIMRTSFSWHFSLGEKYSITTEIHANSLRVDIISPRGSGRVFDWSGLQPASSFAYFAVGTQGFSGRLTGKSVGESSSSKGLLLTHPTGSVVSPPLPPALDRICVSLVFFASRAASIDLHLQLGNSLSLIRKMEGQARPKEGWTHQVLVAEIPETSDIETRLVFTATRPENETLVIKRIAGCNSADSEDTLELPESNITIIHRRGMDVSHNTSYELSRNNTCMNGGLQVEWSGDANNESPVCICPPGFTGNRCSEGCGANSYGADCGGVCSGSGQGCRGVVMCRPMMDCDCAPGYKGAYCERACDLGEYGAGCRQSCGQCKIVSTWLRYETEGCNIYTGICYQGCQPGYMQPYCQQRLPYPSTAPEVVVNDFFNVSVSGNLATLEGQAGDTRYYQLQYRKSGTDLWIKAVSQALPDEKERSAMKLGNVTGLESGTNYEMRVVLIDQTLDSYEGGLVPSVAFSTPCIVPRRTDYSSEDSSQMFLRADLIRDTLFRVKWKIPSNNATWCRPVGFEVQVNRLWKWVTYRVNNDVDNMDIRELLPGRQYTVRVRAITSHGPASFLEALVVKTLDAAPDNVMNLSAESLTARSLKVTWEPPKHPAGNIHHYHVTYQCLKHGACPEDECTDLGGELNVSSTSVLIEDLHPFTVYDVGVAGVSGSLGPMSRIRATTSQTLPDVVPTAVIPATSDRTNTTLKVHWAPPNNFSGINGYFTGYRFELISTGQGATVFVGTTPECTASFTNLTPHAEYIVRVFVVNGAGWSSTRVLEINASTSATAPEAVQDLVVYKRGRRLLGLRWAPPRTTYGSLQSFTVRHAPVGGAQKPVGVSIKPTACPAWPSLFCHTLSNLNQDTDYTISVQARNAEVNEDGEEVSVTATTRESAPGAPSFLRVRTKTSDTMTIEWGIPDLINGQLRSFLVNIEETDSHNSSDCCQYFPIREVVVTSERLDYEFQMTGLRPASTYEISLSAKTVAMGPAMTLTVHTRPLTPVLVQAPRLDGAALLGGPLRVRIEAPADIQGDRVSGYLLLLKGNSGVQPPPLRDEWLRHQLTQALNGSFSLVAEFIKGKLPEGGIVELLPGGELVKGVFGRVGLSGLKPDTEYQLVWVVVLEYCKTLSEGHIISETFTLKQA